MVKVSDVVTLFHEAALVQLTYHPRGHILMTVAGGHRAKVAQMFAAWCRELSCDRPDDSIEGVTPDHETWMIVPADEHRHELSDILIRAWRLYSAEAQNPYITYGNAATEGWGCCQGKQTGEQIKSVLIMLTLGHKVRVYPDQEAARAATYGPSPTPDEGHIALEIDGRVYLISPSGYLHRTKLGAN